MTINQNEQYIDSSTSIEDQAQICRDIRENIGRQLDTLCGDDIGMHFTVRDILAGIIKIKNSQVDNG